LGDLISQTIKYNEGDSANEIRNARNQISKIDEQISRLDGEMISGKLPKANYNKLSHILEIKTKISLLRSKKKIPQEEILKKVLWIMSNLSEIYESADYKGKRRLLEALFPEKLIIEKERCRTAGDNTMLAQIDSISESLEQKKREFHQRFD
jgi:hypothetical protein